MNGLLCGKNLGFYVMNKKKIFILLIVLGCMILTAIAYSHKSTEKNDDLLEHVRRGDFTSLVGLTEKELTELERIYGYYQNVNGAQWIYADINADGVSELIWQEKDVVGNSQVHRILAVFTVTSEGAKCIVWDTNDMGEFYFCLNDKIIYYTSYFGAYDYFYYGLCRCDGDGELSVIKSFAVYDLRELAKEDFLIFLSQSDWAQDVNKTDCGDGKIYYVMGTQSEAEEVTWILLKKDEWVEQFRSEIGIVDFHL